MCNGKELEAFFPNLNPSSSCEETRIVFHIDVCGLMIMSMIISFSGSHCFVFCSKIIFMAINLSSMSNITLPNNLSSLF
jgi:hypothetical protein